MILLEYYTMLINLSAKESMFFVGNNLHKMREIMLDRKFLCNATFLMLALSHLTYIFDLNISKSVSKVPKLRKINILKLFSKKLLEALILKFSNLLHLTRLKVRSSPKYHPYSSLSRGKIAR